jgi:hypothetical protein
MSTAPVAAQDAFITTWETTSADESITIYTRSNSVDYDFTIDWGDGNTETIAGDDPDPLHTYSNAGTYTVKITGTFPHLFLAGSFSNETNAEKLQSIDQWGAIQWRSMERAFDGASNMTYNASDTPDLTNVESMRYMFNETSNFNGAIGDWDVSNVAEMDQLFNSEQLQSGHQRVECVQRYDDGWNVLGHEF